MEPVALQNRKPAPKKARKQKAPPCCAPSLLRRCEPFSKQDVALCPLPAGPKDQLFDAFRGAPQFSGIQAEHLLSHAGEGLRVLFLSESVYYARQAASYLTAIRRVGDDMPEPEPDPFDLELMELLGMDGAQDAEAVGDEDCLTVISPRILDPDIDGGSCVEGRPLQTMEVQGANLTQFEGPAVLVAAESGPVLSRKVLEALEPVMEREKDVYIGLRTSQVDLELLEELRLRHRFQVCRIGAPTEEYLCRILREQLTAHGLKLSSRADLSSALRQLRNVRGELFDEADLFYFARFLRDPGKPLGSAELLYNPCALVTENDVSASEELDRMIGLKNVKSALKRQLAAYILGQRRGETGAVYRSLAFAGAPGTGKSVTARLVARILREKGCGTGRFVEAGREDLIGQYLGHTSPKIAKLFEQARGGVLFIDDAGALIPGDRDSYAEEAVNALVRQMELHPETVVIFATYTEEMRALLASNPGLSSRVTKVLEFQAYSDEELLSILRKLASDRNMEIPPQAERVCNAYFQKLRDQKGDRFGNGREARLLLQTAFEEQSLRVVDQGAEEGFLPEDFAAAAKLLLSQEPEPIAKRKIGFY